MDTVSLKPPLEIEPTPIQPTESRKERRRRERKEARASNSGPSGASTPNTPLAQDGPSKNGVKDRGFDPEQDYIAFDFDSVEDLSYGDTTTKSSVKESSSSRRKDKGKEKEKEKDSRSARPRDEENEDRPAKRRRSRSNDGERERSSRRAHIGDEREREGSSRRNGDRHKGKQSERHDKRDRYDKREKGGRDRDDKPRHEDAREERRDRDRDRSRERRREKDAEKPRDKGKEKAKEREWDRGKSSRTDRDREDGSNRKYEMVFDLEDGYANKKQRTDANSRKCPWATNIDWNSCTHVAEMLHKEVEAFTNWISASPVEDEIRGLTVSLITRAVVSAFPDASVLPFGSYETKLYLPLGDIDLVILSQSMAYSNKVTVLQALANVLRKAGITDRVTVISKAKVPIIKFITTHGRFNVDISLNQENGLLSGRIINGFLGNMHGLGLPANGNIALRSLVMVTKAFLSQRSMNEVFTGGLGSYSIVCLAVSFLQMHPKIRGGEIDPNKNLGVLLMEFFELYGIYFNYEEVGISLREGGMYFNKKRRGWHSYEKAGLLSIEDPADPSNDISRGSYAFPKVKTTFAGAFNILTTTAWLQAGIIQSRREGRSVNLRSQPDPDEMSILSSVMGITQETLNHRRLVQELYDKRTLHNMLGVKPRPEVVSSNGGGASTTSRSPSTPGVSVAAAHGEEKDGREDHKRRHLDEDEEDEEKEVIMVEDSDDEGGRYNIGRQPPKKRQKTGKQEDVHTVFTTDDDDDEEDMQLGSDSEAEEAHYASPSDSGDGSRSTSKNPSKLSSDKRRSYWVSKGIGLGEDQEVHDEDDYD